MITSTQEFHASIRHLTSLTDMLTAMYLDSKERNDFTLFSSTAEIYFVKIQELNSEVRAHMRKPENAEPETTLEELVAGITEQNRHSEIDSGPAVGDEIW